MYVPISISSFKRNYINYSKSKERDQTEIIPTLLTYQPDKEREKFEHEQRWYEFMAKKIINKKYNKRSDRDNTVELQVNMRKGTKVRSEGKEQRFFILFSTY